MGNKRVAVNGIPQIEGVRAQSFQREVGHESELGSQGLLDSAMARLDFVAQGVDVGRDFGVMGAAFRPGAAVGTSSVMGCHGGSALLSVTPAQISAMPLRPSKAISGQASSGSGKPTATKDSMDMSPRSARIGVLCCIFR